MNEPVTVAQLIAAATPTVWQALTDVKAMRQWYFDVHDFKPEPGFAFTFAGEAEGVAYIHHCTVIEVVPYEKISYSWRYQGHEGDSLVTFLLHAQLPGTLVTVVHAGIESFGESNPHLTIANFAAGWQYLLQTALKNFAEMHQAGSST